MSEIDQEMSSNYTLQLTQLEFDESEGKQLNVQYTPKDTTLVIPHKVPSASSLVVSSQQTTCTTNDNNTTVATIHNTTDDTNNKDEELVEVKIGPQHFDLIKLIGEGAFGKVSYTTIIVYILLI